MKMTRTYGIGYQGSKNRIAKYIIGVLPSGARFVDLFAGGCSITHCAMLSGKYNRFLANDIDVRIPQTFKDAIEGKFANERRWISRDDFFKLKESDMYARLCFSFGNNQKTYMYNPNIEPYKKACHYAIVFDEWDQFKRLCPETVEAAMNALDGLPREDWKQIKERRLKFGPSVVNEVKRIGLSEDVIMNNPLYKSIKKKSTTETQLQIQNLGRLERLCELQSLQSLGRLERLQSLQVIDGLYCQLEVSSIDYREYEHQDGDVVYCDPPYNGTGGYCGKDFDHNAFYEWARTRDYPVYFSEYNAPDDFVCVWSKPICKIFLGGKSAHNKAIEKLFIHKRFAQ